ncbi:DGQHR domain-containing protein [Candidatus Parcubacteria bacterium]|nr:DGQHR domain-containing protein [Candidatus Parcubacteria bacterium]
MNKFKTSAIEILKNVKKPLHYKEITRLALKSGILETEGATPEASMNSQIVMDIKKRGLFSDFVKIASGIFALNPQRKVLKQSQKIKRNGEESNKKVATNFEEKIKQFLENLEFCDVDGARDNFLINNIQVDVCGGWDNALLVIECKTKQKLGKKNLRAAISEFRGKILLLQKGLKNHPVYSKYTYFKYIIVTKNIRVRKCDYDFANQYPSIYIWNDDFLEYYSSLYNFIKPYAKYDLLGEMRIKPIQKQPITVPAFQVKLGNVNVYNFVMNPKDLLEVAFVARREVGIERYYQRIIEKERLSKIAKYIEGGGTFPNNIIISFKKDLDVKFHLNKGPDYSSTNWPYKGISYGILEFPKDYRNCWIIDGQHRLYAFVNVKKDFYFNMPITAFEHLDIKEQCKFFLDINKNQKPVSSDLLWDLNGETIASEEDGIISNTVKFLNLEDRGPLFFKIYYPSTGVKKKLDMIKISALCIAIKKRKLVGTVTLQNIKNPLYHNDPAEHIKKLGKCFSKYFSVLKNTFPDNWELASKGFILTNGGISVMIGLFEKILSRIMQQRSQEPTKEDFDLYVQPLKKQLESENLDDLKKLRLRCTSEAGKTDLLTEFILKIRSETDDDQFGGEIQVYKLKGSFLLLEKRLKKLIKKKLYDPKNKDWFRNATDEDMYGRALKIMKKNGIADMNKIHLQIGLGDCFSLMRKNSKLFYPIFIGENKPFANKTIFEGAISVISTMRAKLGAHHTGTEIRDREEDILIIHLEQINACLDKTLNF